MSNEKTNYCPHCSLVVAPGDREKVANEHGTFHGACWKKIRDIQERLAKLNQKLALATATIQ